MQKCPVPLVSPNCKWDNLTATMGGRERHATPLAPPTISGERASRKRKSLTLGGTQGAKQLGNRLGGPGGGDETNSGYICQMGTISPVILGVPEAHMKQQVVAKRLWENLLHVACHLGVNRRSEK